jgi:DNA-nicking Smr family endonuclease
MAHDPRDPGDDASDARRPGGGDPDDAALFRDAIGPVRALPAQPAPPPKPRPRAAPRMAQRDEAEAASAFRRAITADALEAGDALAYRRDAVPPRTLQRLRRGDFAAQDELDLHWTDARQAEAMLREFLLHARQQGHGCVRVIHGKGLHGDSNAPVLKNLVDRVLRHRADVLAFASAPANQGGTGATLVLLAAKR